MEAPLGWGNPNERLSLQGLHKLSKVAQRRLSFCEYKGLQAKAGRLLLTLQHSPFQLDTCLYKMRERGWIAIRLDWKVISHWHKVLTTQKRKTFCRFFSRHISEKWHFRKIRGVYQGRVVSFCRHRIPRSTLYLPNIFKSDVVSLRVLSQRFFFLSQVCFKLCLYVGVKGRKLSSSSQEWKFHSRTFSAFFPNKVIKEGNLVKGM